MENKRKENTKEKNQPKFLPLEDLNKEASGWLAYDIVWDTCVRPTGLPTTVAIEDESVEFDEVTKYLAGKYGCSVYSLGIRPLTREAKKRLKENKIIQFPV